ncbi:MAG: O-antigen ligase family protein [Candidatus Pelagibacter sp.]
MFNLFLKKYDNTFYLLLFLPISFLIGSLFSNITAVLLSIIYLIYIIRNNKIRIIKEKQHLFLFLLFAIFILSSINSNYKLEGLENSFSYLSNIFLFLGMSLYFLNEKNKIQLLSKIVTIILIFLCLDCWLQFLLGENIFGYERQQAGRLTSVFKSEQIPGSVIFHLSPFLLYFLYSTKNFYLKKFKFLILIFVYFSIIITGERNSSIISSILIFLIVILNFKKTYFKQLLVYFFLIIISFSVLYFKKDSNLKDRINYTIYQITKDNIYFGMYGNALSIFSKNKIFGTGPQTFRYECYKLAKYPGKAKVKEIGEYCSSHPHNYYFELLSDAGFFAPFIFFIGLLSLVLNKIKKISNKLINSLIIIYPLLFFFPFLPSGSFFSSLHMTISWFSIGFLFSIKDFSLSK